jgi:hypothetical protein
MRFYKSILLSVVILTILAVAGCTGMNSSKAAAGEKPMMSGKLEGFETSPYWNEQVKTFMYEPEVKIHINAPSVAEFDRSKHTQVIFYTLPNGNTTAQTIGCQRKDGLDWHYYIQHIGAQTRALRAEIKDQNIIVIYLEAGMRSWPTWRKKQGYKPELITGLVDNVTAMLDLEDYEIVLSSHSGGGSFLFGFINGYDEFPKKLKRISFMDSNYGFDVDDGHGTKLLNWLKKSKDHQLTVLAYDDREITYNGKKVVGPTGGTFRATHRMIDRFEKELKLTKTSEGDYDRYKGMNGQIDLITHNNLANKILHTVLVEKNGFIHSMTVGTKYEDKVGIFYGPSAYDEWVQPEPSVLEYAP